jgi:methylated-DNA-[protein]-cysteine S-methyltransferase
VAPADYVLAPSPFGPLVVLWRQEAKGPRVQRVLLPRQGQPADEQLQVLRRVGQSRTNPIMRGLAERITAFLEGEAITFPLEVLALETCSEFQQRVLRAEHAIPRGQVSTYGRIAQYLGLPGAARAVGRALATNPFPILIPCHRAVRSDGTLGGYQGGPAMKRKLLALEGVEVQSQGAAASDRFYDFGRETGP